MVSILLYDSFYTGPVSYERTSFVRDQWCEATTRAVTHHLLVRGGSKPPTAPISAAAPRLCIPARVALRCRACRAARCCTCRAALLRMSSRAVLRSLSRV